MKAAVRDFSGPPFRSARLVAARHGLVARATHGQADPDFGVRVEAVPLPQFTGAGARLGFAASAVDRSGHFSDSLRAIFR